MKRLNNKGYMLIEIIVASVIAFGIGYYLIELTYNFSSKDEDLYQSISMIADKVVITKNIMNDIDGREVTDIVQGNRDEGNISYISFNITLGEDESEPRRLEVNKSDKEITYGYYNDEGFDTSDDSYYYKKLSDSVVVGDISIEGSDILYIDIPLSTIYSSDSSYDIKIVIEGTLYMMGYESGYAFWNGTYLENITSVVFTDTEPINIYDNMKWDITVGGNSELIMAYLTSDNIYGGYILSIVASGKIYTNDLSHFFAGMTNLESVDFSNLDTSKVTNMSYMFYKCSGLTSLNLSSFNTTNVTNMSYMFSECSGLTTSLDLSSFTFDNVTACDNMFSGVSNDIDIYVKDSEQLNLLKEKINDDNVNISIKE